MWDLSSPTKDLSEAEIEPVPCALEAWGLNHWDNQGSLPIRAIFKDSTIH